MKIHKQTIKKFLLHCFVLLSINQISGQCTTPTLVTASPSTFCSVGGTLNLNGTSVGNFIKWYTVPVGGVSLGQSLSGANFSTTAVATTTYYAESFNPGIPTTYTYTGALQQVTVPAGVSQITITAIGAKGGSVGVNSGGSGTSMQGVFAVVPGNVLNIVVGGQGNPDAASSGGGGASGVAIGVTPLIVAGGGGGINGGGGYAGSNAVLTTGGVIGQSSGGAGGVGGADGGDWIYVGNGNNTSRGGRGFNFNNAGSLGQNGSSVNTTTTQGTWGIGGGGGSVGSGYCNCGGGGGGYSGGGSANINASGGGGGSYNNGTNQVNTLNAGTGNGTVTILGLGSACVGPIRTPVVVTVNPNPTVTISGASTVCAGSSVSLTANGANTYSWNNGAVTSTIAPSPTVNTTYSVIGTSSAGCTGTVSQAVTVNASPTVAVTGPTAAVCAGTSVNISASGAASYSWSTGAVTSTIAATPTTNTSYTVVGTNTAGCSTSAVTSVTVNALPSVSIAGAGTICIGGQTATLTANGANTYSWSTGSTSSSIAVTPTITTTYTATGTNTAGCVNTATASVIVNPCTGINQFGVQSSAFRVYPNPSSGEFTVELNNGLNKTVEITDATGRVVLSNTSNKDKMNVNITHLSNGIYYVKILSNNVTEVLKVVKQ